MTSAVDRPCGCRYVRVQGQWWQVVSCPGHRMSLKPVTEVPD